MEPKTLSRYHIAVEQFLWPERASDDPTDVTSDVVRFSLSLSRWDEASRENVVDRRN